MKKIVAKKISNTQGSFHAKVRQFGEEREKRMHDTEQAVIHSGLVEQLKKVKSRNSTTVVKSENL
ncbi:hypothetical protein GFS24_17310 [Chitinophaga sp. SYP-B3965]|uniref:hypothetical protein n=1 Tax=Chitinophaga sp. SYP-B3965 TaxID=2663120 RepID=UPI00129A0864|nr:hypothetical protein [Chitinophaga sp. SYP-B3965]MRG46883.1 hypothetical protein [Chitinophaga sp. SYP-B3965]